MIVRPAVVAVVAALVAVAACSGGGHAMSRVAAGSAVKAGASDAAHLLGATWAPLASPRDADAIITQRCGDPRAGLDAPGAGILGRATSPVLLRDENVGPSPTETIHARTAVIAYKDNASATAAFTALGFAEFERCLLAAVSAYLRADHPDASPAPKPSPGEFTVSSPAVSAGDAAVMYAATFDENVLGGSDNSHAVALFVARSGSFLVTALAACNRQNLNADHATALARRLGRSALTHATARN